MQKATEGERLLEEAVLEILPRRGGLGPAEIRDRAGIHTIKKGTYKGPVATGYGDPLTYGILDKLLEQGQIIKSGDKGKPKYRKK